MTISWAVFATIGRAGFKPPLSRPSPAIAPDRAAFQNEALSPTRFPIMSSWTCPHDLDGICQKVNGARCDPGMKGCVLFGKVRFANEEQNQVRKPVKAEPKPAAKPEAKPVPQPRRRLPF